MNCGLNTWLGQLDDSAEDGPFRHIKGRSTPGYFIRRGLYFNKC